MKELISLAREIFRVLLNTFSLLRGNKMFKMLALKHNYIQVNSCATVSAYRASSMRLSTIVAAFLTLVLLSQTGLARAANYYVSTAGSDSNSGTQSQPWRTIQKAANTVSAGDTVLVAGGTYKEKVKFPRSGTASQKIIFKNVDGQTPIIDGSNLSIGQWDNLISIVNVNYLRLEGFEIRNSGYDLIYIGGNSTHLEIVNNDIHGASNSGLWISGPNTSPAFSVIEGNKIHNNNLGGITLWQSDAGYYLIENNEVYSNTGTSNYDGVQIGGGSYGTHHIIVRNNIIHDNGSADTGEDNLDLGGHGENHHYLVEGNDVYGGTGSFKLHDGGLVPRTYTPGVSGFHIARFNRFTGIGYVCYGFPTPIAVYNNTFVNPSQAFMIYNEDSSFDKNVGDSTYVGGDTGRMNWKNNIFWQETPSGGYVILTAGAGSIDVSYRSVRLQNNLYKLASGQKIGWNNIYGNGAPIDDVAFANYKSSNSPDLPDSGSLLTTEMVNKMFSNYASRDYQLVAGSPAIDKGTPITEAINSGANSINLKVDRASYFQDGYCVSGECLNTPDAIVIGGNPPVKILSINDAANTITLASPQTWKVGDSVTLEYRGVAPDIGAFEFALAIDTSPPSPPTNVRVVK